MNLAILSRVETCVKISNSVFYYKTVIRNALCTKNTQTSETATESCEMSLLTLNVCILVVLHNNSAVAPPFPKECECF